MEVYGKAFSLIASRDGFSNCVASALQFCHLTPIPNE